MTAQNDLKKLVRARMARTGESYTTARMMMLGESAEQAAQSEVPAAPVDAIVLKLNARSARVRLLGENGDVTLRSADLHRVLPGQVATVQLTKRWTYQGDTYASGAITGARTDISALGLEPLPLEAQGDYDAADFGEPYDDDADPYTALWRRWTGRPRPSFSMHPIAWGGREAWESDDDELAPISDAAEFHEEGRIAEARELVMNVLCDDLRCVDGHAHLGNWAFGSWEDFTSTNRQRRSHTPASTGEP